MMLRLRYHRHRWIKDRKIIGKTAQSDFFVGAVPFLFFRLASIDDGEENRFRWPRLSVNRGR